MPCTQYVLSAFAVAGIDVDMAYAPEPILIAGKIPVIPYECPGTLELARSIIPYVNTYKVVMLGNHGPISWGISPMDAWYTLESAEAFAKNALIVKYIIGEARILSKEQLSTLSKNICTVPEYFFDNAADVETNKVTGKSLSKMEGLKINLTDETIDKLSEKLMEKIKVKVVST